MTHSRPLSFGWGGSRPVPVPRGWGGCHLSPARPWDSPWTSTLPPTPATTCMRRRRADAPVATPGGPADTCLPAHCGTGGMAEPRLDGAWAGRSQLWHTHTHTHTRTHTHTHTHRHAPVVTAVPAHTAGHPGPASTSPAASHFPRRGGGSFPAGTTGERMQRGGCEEAQTQRGREGGRGRRPLDRGCRDRAHTEERV